MRFFRPLLPLLLVLLAGFGVAASAHDPGLSTATLRREGDQLVLETDFAFGDAPWLISVAERPQEKLHEPDFARWQPTLLATTPSLWTVRTADGTAVPFMAPQVALRPGDNVGLIVRLPFPDPTAKLTFTSERLGALPSEHRQLVSVVGAGGRVIRQELLTAAKPALTVDFANPGAGADGKPAPRHHFGGFLKLGIEHILTGHDHLLFLFSLLLVARSLRSALVIITAFTLAHSLTLAAATLDWFNLPNRIAEPAIAATILFVGLENLWSRGEEPRRRWIVTFLFGLIHGFGFANILREVGVGTGEQGIGLPLFAFNLGVELGQIALAAFALPLIWRLRKNPTFVRRVIPALSILIALAGAAWLVQRLLLG